MVRAVIMALVAYAVWLLWSGIYQPLLLILGAASCIFVVLICRPMGLLDEEGVPIHVLPRLITYIPWLVLAGIFWCRQDETLRTHAAPLGIRCAKMPDYFRKPKSSGNPVCHTTRGNTTHRAYGGRRIQSTNTGQ